MFRTNSSQIDEGRGKSVGGNNFSLTGLRYFKPKFLSNLNSNDDTHGKSKIKKVQDPKKIIVKKENVPPPDIQIFPKQSFLKSAYEPKRNVQKTHQQPELLLYSKVKGLHNIGNTCYLNSTLQCLFHIPKLNTRFLKQIKQLKKKADCAIQYSQIIQQITSPSSSTSALNVATFKKSIGKKKPRFLGNSQQDAQQFLTSFLEVINEELSRITSKPKYQELEGDPTKKSLTEISNEWWNYYLKRDDSIICDLFQAQILSTVKCKKCKNKSVTFDNIWGLPLSLSRGRNISELIERHWQSESVIEDYHCSKCQKLLDCTRTFEFFRLPEVIVIQLKRFEYGRFNKRKINDEIKIEKELNLSNFLNEEAKKTIKNGKYTLSGIIHHSGQIDFGHYIATVYDHKNKKWFEMNDSRFEECTLPSSTKTGYILFYLKQ